MEAGVGEAEGGKVEREGEQEGECRVEQRDGERLEVEVDGPECGGDRRGEEMCGGTAMASEARSTQCSCALSSPLSPRSFTTTTPFTGTIQGCHRGCHMDGKCITTNGRLIYDNEAIRRSKQKRLHG
jgi:hypothetical protein